jgi:hypothetical protein
MKNLISQSIGQPLKGLGPLGLEGFDASSAGDKFSKFISTAIGLMTLIAFIWFLFLLITGAIGYMTAGGDKNAVQAAGKRFSNAIVGVVVLIAAIFILVLIGYLMGLDMRQVLDPGLFLSNVWGG